MAAAEEDAEEEEEAVPEPNDDGSDLDTMDRSFLGPKKFFGLSFLMNFIAKFRELIGTRMEKISVEKTEKRDIKSKNREKNFKYWPWKQQLHHVQFFIPFVHQATIIANTTLKPHLETAAAAAAAIISIWVFHFLPLS